MFGSGKGYVWWMKIGVKWGSTVPVFASLNVVGVSTRLDQASAIGEFGL